MLLFVLAAVYPVVGLVGNPEQTVKA